MNPQDTPSAGDWNRFWGDERARGLPPAGWSKRRIISVIERHPVEKKKILDAGCGSGFFSRYFCDHQGETVSLDFSRQALENTATMTQGRAQILQLGLVKDGLAQAGLGPFDLIFSDGLFEHFSFSDQDIIMKNLMSVLADQGVIITFVPNRWSPWQLVRPFFMPGISERPFTLRQLVDLNVRNGLRVREKGGGNTLPVAFSPEGPFASYFGMLLYTVAGKPQKNVPLL
ncbi:MAG: class I SAM-dependent methyltransferase [Candidatus Omnitrophota bacterium]